MKNFAVYNEYPPIFQEFISYKSVIQGCSEKTVEEYALDFAESVEALVDDAEEDMAD